MNSVDRMDRYKIQASIKDVIVILDSAPMRRDLVTEMNIVQLTNRVPIAHLAIEKGLKALIKEAGGTFESRHRLQKLYEVLSTCDVKSANYLAKAFGDAVKFYGYNINVSGFMQFRSLDDYLSKVGNDSAFDLFRYWAIGETGKGESPVPYVSLPLHREILQALCCSFLPTRRETVSERVEREVAPAMLDVRHIGYSEGDTAKKDSVHWYLSWLGSHTTRCSALGEAVGCDFAIKNDDKFVSQTLHHSYYDLLQSKDPAVQYFVRTLTYLPKGTRLRNPDAIPEIEWLNQAHTFGSVATPAGTSLGFIEKYADGGWGIEPSQDGLVQVTDTATSVADAKNYLVNRLTREATITANGESRRLRVVSESDFFLPFIRTMDVGDPTVLSPRTLEYDLEFWDGKHGLRPGDQVLVELHTERSNAYGSILEGTVVSVVEQKVSITGMETLASRKVVERDAQEKNQDSTS